MLIYAPVSRLAMVLKTRRGMDALDYDVPTGSSSATPKLADVLNLPSLSCLTPTLA